MGCRGCAGTAGYLLRDNGSVGTPAAANVFLLCGHDSVSPRTAQETSPACACGQKTTLRAPRRRPSRASAPHRKSSPAAQRTGGHRRVATRKATGDLTTRRGAVDPVRRAEWMAVLRYGHLRSAPVVVDACLRTEREPPTLRAALYAPCLGASSMASCLSSDALARLHCHRLRATPSDKVQKFVRDAFCRVPKNACGRRI